MTPCSAIWKLAEHHRSKSVSKSPHNVSYTKIQDLLWSFPCLTSTEELILNPWEFGHQLSREPVERGQPGEIDVIHLPYKTQYFKKGCRSFLSIDPK